MTVEIPPEFTDFVQGIIASGDYRSEAEVVVEALRVLQQREQRLQELRQEIQPALERLDRGEGKELDLEEVKARGMTEVGAQLLRRREQLRRKVKAGVEQLDRGEYTEYDEDSLAEFSENIKATDWGSFGPEHGGK